MSDREITALREIIGRIHRRTIVKPDMELIAKLALDADEILKKVQSLPTDNARGRFYSNDEIQDIEDAAAQGREDFLIQQHENSL